MALDYQIDYDNLVQSQLPPDKRTPEMIEWMKGLVSEIANDSSLLFIQYMLGSVDANWVAGTYNRRDRVRYGKAIYEALRDNITSVPTNSNDWRLLQTTFIGSNDRLRFRGEKLVFEYALNLCFGTTFRQPLLISDIFITTNPTILLPVFRVGYTEIESSSVTTETSSEFVVNAYTFTTQVNATINVPLAVYNALGATNNIRDTIIREFADKYFNAGIIYTISPY